MGLDKLQWTCSKCGTTGEMDNWPGSPYSAEDQPIGIVCERCAMWNNYEATDGRPKGLKLDVSLKGAKFNKLDM